MMNPIRSIRPAAAVLALVFAAWHVASAPSWAQAPASEPGRRIAQCLQPFVDNDTLAGAVTLVASKDKVLSLEAVGYADVAAKKPMQTGDLLSHGKSENGYGLGWSTSRKARGQTGAAPVGGCGHGGAYATNMSIDPQHQLVTVFMVQHAGFPGPDGNKVQPAFAKAAMDAFGN